MENPTRIVIAGGGTAGWMCAAAFARFMAARPGGTGVDIVLVESDDIGTIGVGEATIPQIRLFNARLGLDEDDFLRRTKATIKLGIEFDGWLRPGEAYMHAFGTPGRDLNYTAFHHYWLKSYQTGESPDIWAYSLNTLAAYGGKFMRLDQSPNGTIPPLAHAFHFDAGLYAQYLRQFAERLGARRVEGMITEVMQNSETGDITGLKLAEGQVIAGDLFIDCSGLRGLLIEGALKSGYEDWSHWLPMNRAWAVPCESVTPLTPYTRSTARASGWQWRIPLQHRIGNGHVFSAEHISETDAADVLMQTLDGKALADPRLIRFTTGRRKTYWVRNCIAMGLASGFIEPLESTSIHLIQSAIARLISLFPQPGQPLANEAVRERYNRDASAEIERVRDFIILHYMLNERPEPFWQACRHMSVPDSLTNTIDLFRESGVLLSDPQDLFQPPSWLQVLLGQGVVPRNAHPSAGLISAADRNDYLANLRAIYERAVAQMPTHDSFIAGRTQAT